MNASGFAVVSNGMVSKQSLVTGNVLKYSFNFTDLGIKDYEGFENFGVYDSEIEVVWKSGKQEISQFFSWKGSGSYSGKIKIRKGMRNGTWRIARIEIYESKVSPDKHAYEEEEDSLVLYNKDLSSYKGKSSAIDLSFSNVKVQTNGKTDKEAPTVKSVKLVKKGKKVKWQIKFNEPGGIRYVKYSYSKHSKKAGQLGWEDFLTMTYNKKSKCYEAVMPGSSRIKKNEYITLDYVRVCDIYGNSAIIRDKSSTQGKKKYKADFSKLTIYGKK